MIDNRQLVSVLMPVHNCESYINRAIESILNQTYTNIELVIVDDYSTDNTYSIVSACNDVRIVKIKNDKNIGPSGSINKAIGLSSGEYLAIMHGDDISFLDRIEKQVDFLVKNSEVGIVGTQYRAIDFNDKVLPECSNFPIQAEQILYSLLFCNVMCHPSVMIRRSVLHKSSIQYNFELRVNEDYEFWTKAIHSGIKLANLPEIFLYYRRHEKQASVIRASEESQVFIDLRKSYRERFGDDIKSIIAQIEGLSSACISNLAKEIKSKTIDESGKKIFYNQIAFYIHSQLKNGQTSFKYNILNYFDFLRIVGWGNLKIQILYRFFIRAFRR